MVAKLSTSRVEQRIAQYLYLQDLIQVSKFELKKFLKSQRTTFEGMVL